MKGLFWKKSRARNRSRIFGEEGRAISSVTRASKSVTTEPPASRRIRVAPRSKPPFAALARISERRPSSLSLMPSVAIGQRGTSTRSKRVPWRRKPIGKPADWSCFGALKWGVIFER